MSYHVFGMLFISTLAGWLTGGMANWAADTLPAGLRSARIKNVGAWPHYWTLWWFFGRTDCPHCGTTRSWRIPIVEATMAVTFGATAYFQRRDLTTLVVFWFYVAFLLTILVIDLEHRRILNVMLAPAAVVICLISLLPHMPGLANALAGGAFGFAMFLLIHILGRGRLGAGDVKLAGIIGLMTGYPAVWTALFSGVMLGGVAGIFLLWSRRAGRKSTMAYAPYLAIGAIFTIWVTIGSP